MLDEVTKKSFWILPFLLAFWVRHPSTMDDSGLSVWCDPNKRNRRHTCWIGLIDGWCYYNSYNRYSGCDTLDAFITVVMTVKDTFTYVY